MYSPYVSLEAINYSQLLQPKHSRTFLPISSMKLSSFASFRASFSTRGLRHTLFAEYIQFHCVATYCEWVLVVRKKGFARIGWAVWRWSALYWMLSKSGANYQLLFAPWFAITSDSLSTFPKKTLNTDEWGEEVILTILPIFLSSFAGASIRDLLSFIYSSNKNALVSFLSDISHLFM